MQKNVFVIALGDFNRRLLQTIRGAEGYNFHSLFSPEQMVAAPSYPIDELIEEGRLKIQSFPGRVDAIVGYWDFPTTLLLPTLRTMAELPTTSTESILRCVHKYWSRTLQKEVAEDLVPRFHAFDPFAVDPFSSIDLEFPFWIKPIKAHSSILGFRIENRDDFDKALPQIRKGIDRFAKPFNDLFERADPPAEIAAIDGRHCLAEEMISAENQCTLEGYVFRGEPRVYGIVDSLRERHSSSFSRYHYPSRLPGEVLQRMIAATDRIMRRTGLNNEPFNIEFFHDPDTHRITLLEINPRISKSHCPLFYFVEGASHQEVMVEMALGRQPEYPRGEGAYPMASKFMLRRYSGDALVKRVPHTSDIETMLKEVDGTMLKLRVTEGDRLSDDVDQDSYSFEYANLFIGAQNEEELQEKYNRCMELLPFEFEPLADQEL